MITAKNLTKIYEVSSTGKATSFSGRIMETIRSPKNKIVGLDNFTAIIGKGESVGIIGPNGAGKSTFVKLACGILSPTSGSISIMGYPAFKKRKKLSRKYSVVFGQRSVLWKNVPIIDSFRVQKAIYTIPKIEFEEKVKTLSKLLELETLLHRVPRKLSLGQRMRCEFAAAFLHDPEVVFLDEPLIGMDVVTRKRIRDFLYEMQVKRRVTVILMSHNINDIEMISDRLIVLLKGRIRFDGTPDEFKGQIKPVKYFDVSLDAYASIDAWINNIKSIKGVESLEIKNNENDRLDLVITVDTRAEALLDVIKILPADIKIYDITIRDPTLEDVVITVFKERLET